MKTRFKTLILGLILLFGLGMMASPVMADFGHKHYKISVYADEGFTTASGGTTLITGGITYKVLTDDTNTAATIYSDSAGTAMTNPVTSTVFDTKDRIDFYVPSSVTAVDIIIVDSAGGYTTFLDDATEHTRTAIIDERPNIQHHGMIWWGPVTTTPLGAGTQQDTGIDFDIGTLVHKVIVELITGGSSSNFLNIGIDANESTGDLDGFINAMVICTDAGWYDPYQVGISSGTNTNLMVINAVAGAPLGPLLGYIHEGTSTATGGETQGLWLHWDYKVNSNGRGLVYAVSSEGAGTTSSVANGYIHYLFTRFGYFDSAQRVHP